MLWNTWLSCIRRAQITEEGAETEVENTTSVRHRNSVFESQGVRIKTVNSHFFFLIFQDKQCSDFMRAKATVGEASWRCTPKILLHRPDRGTPPGEPEFEHHHFSLKHLWTGTSVPSNLAADKEFLFVDEASHPPSELRLAPDASTQQISKPEDCFSEGGPGAERFVLAPSDHPSVPAEYLPESPLLRSHYSWIRDLCHFSNILVCVVL